MQDKLKFLSSAFNLTDSVMHRSTNAGIYFETGTEPKFAF